MSASRSFKNQAIEPARGLCPRAPVQRFNESYRGLRPRTPVEDLERRAHIRFGKPQKTTEQAYTLS